MGHGVSLYWVCHWTLRRYSMILQEDSCKHIRSKAANGDDGIHVPHGVLNGVCWTACVHRRDTDASRLRKWCQKTNSKMVPETWRPLPLCVHCAHPVSQRLSTSLNVSRLFKRVPARRKGLDGGHALVGHHWASLTNWTGHIPAMTWWILSS